MELEEEGFLPFLDTRVTRLGNAKLDITVYHKKMHTDRYLYFESHFPCKERDGKVHSQPSSKSYATRREPEGEPSHENFIGNGYPRAFVRPALKQRTPREPDDNDNETERPPMVYLPYVAGISERIRYHTKRLAC